MGNPKYDFKEILKTIIEVISIAPPRYQKKLISLAYSVNKHLPLEEKHKLRRLYCKKCKTQISVINHRSDCKCHRYFFTF